MDKEPYDGDAEYTDKIYPRKNKHGNDLPIPFFGIVANRKERGKDLARKEEQHENERQKIVYVSEKHHDKRKNIIQVVRQRGKKNGGRDGKQEIKKYADERRENFRRNDGIQRSRYGESQVPLVSDDRRSEPSDIYEKLKEHTEQYCTGKEKNARYAKTPHHFLLDRIKQTRTGAKTQANQSTSEDRDICYAGLFQET